MISIDERTGSKELLTDLRKFGVDCDIAGKLAADFEFVGNGPDDDTIMVGFERKTITDLISSMREKRLAGAQAKAMIDTYQRRFVIVEGLWRCGDSGLVEILCGREWRVARGQIRYAEMIRFLASMREFGGFIVVRTSTQLETARYIAEEWHWWNDKLWSEHTTHRTLYNPDPTKRANGRPSLWRRDSPLLELWLGKLPGIDSKAESLCQYFESAQDMANAPVCRWELIKGIGRKTAENIVAAIRGTRECPPHE